jgi:catechol 2,3-dioxygenase-like lactoylglutathione lyase family enzyme
MILACSHVVLASTDVGRITRFFGEAFDLAPAFENDTFAEFVLPSGFRVAFFVPTGPAARAFDASASRSGGALGVTVRDVDAAHARLHGIRASHAITLSGPPKDHPWGERSFLVTDPDGNRWEVAQSPSDNGMLVGR